MNRIFSTRTILTFSIMMLGFFSSINANAALVSTDQMLEQAQTSVSRDQIISAFEREDVRQVLVSKGVDLDAARARINAMSDQEIAALHSDIDSLPAGAGVGTVLVTVVLVFVILDILGITNVFTFIR